MSRIQDSTIAVLVGLSFLILGCRSQETPKIRVGDYPTPTIAMTFIDINDLGPHGYAKQRGEGNGIVYTCRAGHIDITHVRSTADWTKYIAERIHTCFQQRERDFSFESNIEPSRFLVRFSYTKNRYAWTPEATWQASVAVGQYLIWIAATWHEILTWFGHRNVGIFSEYPSAFSWEDTYSNALGIELAGRVLREGQQHYDERFTTTLRNELIQLGIQPRDIAIQVVKRMKGKWYSGQWPGFVKMQVRNLDIGLDDDTVTPVRVPPTVRCEDTRPYLCSVPTLASLNQHGIKVQLHIEPRERVKDRILKVIYPDQEDRPRTIDPTIHFPPLMHHIRQQATERGLRWEED